MEEVQVSIGRSDVTAARVDLDGAPAADARAGAECCGSAVFTVGHEERVLAWSARGNVVKFAEDVLRRRVSDADAQDVSAPAPRLRDSALVASLPAPVACGGVSVYVPAAQAPGAAEVIICVATAGFDLYRTVLRADGGQGGDVALVAQAAAASGWQHRPVPLPPAAELRVCLSAAWLSPTSALLGSSLGGALRCTWPPGSGAQVAARGLHESSVIARIWSGLTRAQRPAVRAVCAVQADAPVPTAAATQLALTVDAEGTVSLWDVSASVCLGTAPLPAPPTDAEPPGIVRAAAVERAQRGGRSSLLCAVHRRIGGREELCGVRFSLAPSTGNSGGGSSSSGGGAGSISTDAAASALCVAGEPTVTALDHLLGSARVTGLCGGGSEVVVVLQRCPAPARGDGSDQGDCLPTHDLFALHADAATPRRTRLRSSARGAWRAVTEVRCGWMEVARSALPRLAPSLHAGRVGTEEVEAAAVASFTALCARDVLPYTAPAALAAAARADGATDAAVEELERAAGQGAAPSEVAAALVAAVTSSLDAAGVGGARAVPRASDGSVDGAEAATAVSHRVAALATLVSRVMGRAMASTAAHCPLAAAQPVGNGAWIATAAHAWHGTPRAFILDRRQHGTDGSGSALDEEEEEDEVEENTGVRRSVTPASRTRALAGALARAGSPSPSIASAWSPLDAASPFLELAPLLPLCASTGSDDSAAAASVAAMRACARASDPTLTGAGADAGQRRHTVERAAAALRAAATAAGGEAAVAAGRALEAASSLGRDQVSEALGSVHTRASQAVDDACTALRQAAAALGGPYTSASEVLRAEGRGGDGHGTGGGGEGAVWRLGEAWEEEAVRGCASAASRAAALARDAATVLAALAVSGHAAERAVLCERAAAAAAAVAAQAQCAAALLWSPPHAEGSRAPLLDALASDGAKHAHREAAARLRASLAATVRQSAPLQLPPPAELVLSGRVPSLGRLWLRSPAVNPGAGSGAGWGGTPLSPVVLACATCTMRPPRTPVAPALYGRGDGSGARDGHVLTLADALLASAQWEAVAALARGAHSVASALDAAAAAAAASSADASSDEAWLAAAFAAAESDAAAAISAGPDSGDSGSSSGDGRGVLSSLADTLLGVARMPATAHTATLAAHTAALADAAAAASGLGKGGAAAAIRRGLLHGCPDEAVVSRAGALAAETALVGSAHARLVASALAAGGYSDDALAVARLALGLLTAAQRSTGARPGLPGVYEEEEEEEEESGSGYGKHILADVCRAEALALDLCLACGRPRNAIALVAGRGEEEDACVREVGLRLLLSESDATEQERSLHLAPLLAASLSARQRRGIVQALLSRARATDAVPPPRASHKWAATALHSVAAFADAVARPRVVPEPACAAAYSAAFAMLRTSGRRTQAAAVMHELALRAHAAVSHALTALGRDGARAQEACVHLAAALAAEEAALVATAGALRALPAAHQWFRVEVPGGDGPARSGNVGEEEEEEEEEGFGEAMGRVGGVGTVSRGERAARVVLLSEVSARQALVTLCRTRWAHAVSQAAASAPGLGDAWVAAWAAAARTVSPLDATHESVASRAYAAAQGAVEETGASVVHGQVPLARVMACSGGDEAWWAPDSEGEEEAGSTHALAAGGFHATERLQASAHTAALALRVREAALALLRRLPADAEAAAGVASALAAACRAAEGEGRSEDGGEDGDARTGLLGHGGECAVAGGKARPAGRTGLWNDLRVFLAVADDADVSASTHLVAATTLLAPEGTELGSGASVAAPPLAALPHWLEDVLIRGQRRHRPLRGNRAAAQTLEEAQRARPLPFVGPGCAAAFVRLLQRQGRLAQACATASKTLLPDGKPPALAERGARAAQHAQHMDWIPADLLDGLLMDARETLRKAGVQLPELGTADSAEVPEDSQPWVQALAEEVSGLERALMLVLAAGS